MPAPDTFTTVRLVTRRVTRDDEAFVTAMFADAAVNETLGGPRDTARVRELLDRMIDHWSRRAYGTWILRDRSTLEPIGWVGLHDTETGGPGGVELLYAIASSRWREGLATEAGRGAVEIARSDLGLDELVCFTLVDNIGSQRTMKGLGFVDAGPVEHAGLPHVLTRMRLEPPETFRMDEKENARRG